jgi:hypothetical protein
LDTCQQQYGYSWFERRKKEVKLFTVEGQLISDQSTTEDQLEIPTLNLPAGTYILKVTGGKTECVRRIAVVHGASN